MPALECKKNINYLDKQPHMIREMFNPSSQKYDLLNRLRSFSLDRLWRRYLIRIEDLPDSGRDLDAGA